MDIVATKLDIEGMPHILLVARDVSEKIKMEEELKKKTEDLQFLHEFVVSLNRCSSEGEAYNILSKAILDQMGADALTVYQINPSLNRIQNIIHYGDDTLSYRCIDDDLLLECKVVISSKALITEKNSLIMCPLKVQEQDISYFCTNVVSVGKIIAIIVVKSKKHGFFDKEKVEFIESLIDSFSPFVANLRLVEINKELSIRDPLTNLYNRRYLMEFLYKELEKSKRLDRYLSIIMLDLDDFKKINDVYGHQMGDLCLKTLADVIIGNTRDMDVAGRYGGEEFIIVLPDTDKGNALSVANRLRSAIKGIKIPSSNGFITLSASFGVASFPEDGINIDDLIKVADDRTYEAKRSGKDRVVLR